MSGVPTGVKIPGPVRPMRASLLLRLSVHHTQVSNSSYVVCLVDTIVPRKIKAFDCFLLRRKMQFLTVKSTRIFIFPKLEAVERRLFFVHRL